MTLLLQILLNGIAVYLAAYLLPGINVDNFVTAIIVGVVLGIVNTFIKPIIVLLTLPVTIVTLGIFILVINAVLVLLVAWIVPGFTVDNFWWALLFSIFVSLISGFFNIVAKSSSTSS